MLFRSELDLAVRVDSGVTSIADNAAGQNKRQCNPEKEIDAPMDHFPSHLVNLAPVHITVNDGEHNRVPVGLSPIRTLLLKTAVGECIITESLIETRSPEISSSGRITANANHNRDQHGDLGDHQLFVGRTSRPVSHPTDEKTPKKACQIRAISTF